MVPRKIITKSSRRFSFVYLRVLCGSSSSDLKQPFRPSQIPQRTEIRQREREAILVLIPYRTQVETAEFQAYSAAIPVISGLRRSVLQELQFRIEADIGRSAETLFAGVSVAQQKPELVKKLWPENNIRIGRRAVVASANWHIHLELADRRRRRPR